MSTIQLRLNYMFQCFKHTFLEDLKNYDHPIMLIVKSVYGMVASKKMNSSTHQNPVIYHQTYLVIMVTMFWTDPSKPK